MGRRFSKRRSSYIQLAPATVLRTVRPTLWPICSDLIRDGQWPESAPGWPARVAPYCNDRKFGNYCYTVCIPPNTDITSFPISYFGCLPLPSMHDYHPDTQIHSPRSSSHHAQDVEGLLCCCCCSLGYVRIFYPEIIPTLVIPISIHLSQIIPVCRIER